MKYDIHLDAYYLWLEFVFIFQSLSKNEFYYIQILWTKWTLISLNVTFLYKRVCAIICVYAYVYIHIHVCLCACMYMHKYLCICACTCLRMYVCACMCVCLCVWVLKFTCSIAMFLFVKPERETTEYFWRKFLQSSVVKIFKESSFVFLYILKLN